MRPGVDFLNQCKIVNVDVSGVTPSSDDASQSSDGVSFNGYESVLLLVTFGKGGTSDAVNNVSLDVATDSVVPSDGTYAAFPTDAISSDMVLATSDSLTTVVIFVDLKANGKESGCVKPVFGGNGTPGAPTSCWLIFFRGSGPVGGETHSASSVASFIG